jgi:hypothetical protein
MRKPIHYKSFALIIFILTAISISSFGQLRTDSPYSRFGLGDVNPGYNVYQSSLGGVGYGVRDYLRISTINPAAIAAIDSGSFVFNAAFNGLAVNTKTSTQSGSTNYFNLSYLQFGLPVTTWWRTGGGLTPFTTVGYDVSSHEDLDSIGDVRFSHLGDGGVTNIFWNNSFKINKNFSVGINTSYLFGNINYRRESELTEHPYAFMYRLTNNINMKGLYLNYGLQYYTRFGKEEEYSKKKYFFGLGLVYANEQKIKSTKSALGITYTNGAEGNEFVKDTVVDINQGEGYVVIPQKIGGGFSIGQYKKWMIAADVTFNEFSKFSSFGINDSLSNSLRYNFGGQYYIGKVALNAGFKYNSSYLNLNNTPINDYGITFGIGIPLRNNASTISDVDLSFEFGRRGTTINNLIQQDYFQVRLGVNIRNRWFNRPKYL